jgi:hypothetical protein
MARPGMIGVGMGDQGARNGANRVDVKSTRSATQSGRSGREKLLGAHRQ